MGNNKIKSCLVCGGQASKIDSFFHGSVTSDNRFVESDISYSICPECGYLYLDHDKRVDYGKFYKYDYDFLLDSEDVEPAIDGHKYSEYIVDIFSDFIIDSDNKKMLDIGAGKGNIIHAFYNKFPEIQYFAVEPSSAFEKLKEKNFLKQHFHQFYSSALFSEKKFDYILLIEVLEHVDNPRSFLNSVRDVMHEDSLLFIEIPNFEYHKSDILTIDHVSLFTVSQISNLFNICGFEVVKKNITQRIPMQFIVKKNDSNNILLKTSETLVAFMAAKEYVSKIIHDAKLIKGQKVAIYGNNVTIDYMVGMGYIRLEDIVCIINDNVSCQGIKRWKKIKDIVSFYEFKRHYFTKNIFLAMNDVYHERIVGRLDGHDIYGYYL